MDLVINKSNMSGLNEDCEGLNDTYQEVSLTIRGSIAFSSCLMCLIALILMAFFQLFYNTRQSIMYTQRLIVYLTLSALFHSVCLVFETISYKNKDSEYSLLNNSCTTSTVFLIQYSSWVELLFTLVVTVHVVLIAFDIHCKQSETIYILFPLIFPLMFSWTAFVHDIYGIYGAWCWIQKDYLKCGNIPRGLIKQFIIWHGPQCVLLMSTFVIIVIFFGRLRRYVQQSQCKTILQQTIPLVVFSITFQVFSWLGFVNNIYRAVAQKEQKQLWYFHAIVSPAWDLFVGIAATTYTAVLMKTTKRNYTRLAVSDQQKSCEVNI